MSSNEDFLNLKGNISHSVCKWCYDPMPLDKLCQAAQKLGIKSIDLVEPSDFGVLHAYQLDCGMVYGLPEPYGIEKSFNRESHHADLLEIYKELIPKTAAAGFRQVICFSGNREGQSDDEGIEICKSGIKPVLNVAEKHHVNLVIELLNSKVDHPDYQCDHTEWAVSLCKQINHPNFKILYDIYHMQIMEGNIISTINNNHQYISHYHTGGVPGRNEIDETQELYYPAIMEAIMKTGYKGYVAQEFIPKKNPIESLRKAILLCDI
jgi:hydroxypyruvate isomerase